MVCTDRSPRRCVEKWMPFAVGLQEALHFRECQVAAEFTNGDDLEQVLNRHLLAVEAAADGELITSILLLGTDGKRLWHGAAPGLPQAYLDAVDGADIGPCAGSCGTAAYLGRPIYVSDIGRDPLWVDYRALALSHGLRSCWSTPIREPDGTLVGTFAIYRRIVGNPTRDETEAIDMITAHVARAIVLARNVQDLSWSPRPAPKLRIVEQDHRPSSREGDPCSRLWSLAMRLECKAAELDRVAHDPEARDDQTLRATAQISRRLVAVLRRRLDEISRTPVS